MLPKNQAIVQISRTDSRFPALLRESKNCPDLLYIRGTLPPADMPLLTVVGTRRATAYGQRALESILRPLIMRGFGIVSGLAFGIDAAAHELCLSLGGYTAAVIASGLNQVTPVQHIPLARKIAAAGGAMISEMPPDEPIPHKGAYPRRNRILAGMSPMTLVVEAAQKSGAQITAHLAADYGRDVGVVPGPIFSPTSAGCHSLIRKGATLITCAQDVVELYRLSLEEAQATLPALSPEEQAIWQVVGAEPILADAISAQLPYPVSQILTALMRLELSGCVRNIPGQGYVRT